MLRHASDAKAGSILAERVAAFYRRWASRARYGPCPMLARQSNRSKLSSPHRRRSSVASAEYTVHIDSKRSLPTLIKRMKRVRLEPFYLIGHG